MLLNSTTKSFLLSLKKASALVWCLMVLLFSGSPYQTIFNIEILKFLFGALAVVLSISTFSKLKTAQWAMIFILCMAGTTMLVNLEFERQFYLRFLFVVFIAYYISQTFTFRQIVRVFTKLMFFVTLVSFVGYYLANNTLLLDSLPRFANSNLVEFAIGIVFNFITTIPERNCGIFWEPGIFASYLILAIVFEIFEMHQVKGDKKKHVLHLTVFFLGIITANSSAGYALAVVCLFLLLISGRAAGKKRLVLNIFAVFALLALMSVVLNIDFIIRNTPLYHNEYFIKLLSSSLEESARVTAVGHNLEVFVENLWGGAGVYKISMLGVQHADISTVTYALSIFGVSGFVYLGCIIKGVFQQKSINIFSKILFFGIFIAILSKEPHLEMLFTWVLIFGLLNDNNAFLIKEGA